MKEIVIPKTPVQTEVLNKLEATPCFIEIMGRVNNFEQSILDGEFGSFQRNEDEDGRGEIKFLFLLDKGLSIEIISNSTTQSIKINIRNKQNPRSPDFDNVICFAVLNSKQEARSFQMNIDKLSKTLTDFGVSYDFNKSFQDTLQGTI